MNGLAYTPIPAGCGKDTGAAVGARLEEAKALLASSDASYKLASEADDQIVASQHIASAKSDAAKLMAEAGAAMTRCFPTIEQG
jgi:hypothetical protein